MALPKKKPNTTMKKPMPNIGLPTQEDNPFTPLSTEEVEAYDRLDEQEINVSMPTMDTNYTPPPPEFENPKFEDPIPRGIRKPETVYINTEEEQIIPLGGEKSKKKPLQAKDFDKRKNRLTFVKIVRAFSFLAIIIVVLLGIKNTFFPSGTWSKDEVGEISKEALNNTGFPSKRGEAFVEAFMKAYLTIDDKKPEAKLYLSRFYGDKNTDSSEAGSTIPNTSKYYIGNQSEDGVRQSIISGPYVFHNYNVSENVAQYKVTAQITDTNNKGITTSDGKTVNTSRWVSFDVTVYYDTKTNSFVITDDSPSLIPNFSITNKNKIKLPDPKRIGTGDEASEMKATLSPTIDGFLTAFTKVSTLEHNEIDQYIPEDKPAALTAGFGGDVKLAGTATQAIQKTIYKTDKADEWKVDAVVKFANNRPSSVEKNSKKADDSDIIYQSRYILTIKKTGDKYFVTKIVPYVYQPTVAEEEQKNN